MNKNDIAQVEIVDLGTDGNGIGKVNGYTLFIKDTVPGDIVEAKVIKVKKNYGYARVERFYSPLLFVWNQSVNMPKAVVVVSYNRYRMRNSWNSSIIRCATILYE